jgi:hypothetical protein
MQRVVFRQQFIPLPGARRRAHPAKALCASAILPSPLSVFAGAAPAAVTSS